MACMSWTRFVQMSSQAFQYLVPSEREKGRLEWDMASHGLIKRGRPVEVQLGRRYLLRVSAPLLVVHPSLEQAQPQHLALL